MTSASRLPATASQTGSLSTGPRSIPWDKYSVLLMALTVVVCAVLWAFFVDRAQFFDEVGLFNPPYMYLHYGVVTYPAHWQFHSMTVHPPLHYWILGLLMKAGLPPYYAEAIPPLLLILLSVLLVCRSRFPKAAKFAFLFALCVPFLSEYFKPSMRPDVHRGLALFAALLALETGRLQDWSSGRLFLGSFLLTYASALHYPGFVSFLGVVVYVIWVLKERGLRSGRKPLLAMVAGGLVVGIPYLQLFVIPHWTDIAAMLKGTDPVSRSVAANVRTHLLMYEFLKPQFHYREIAILFWPASIGIPLIVIATAGLLVFRPTRAVALAGLPYPVFLLLFVSHKIYWAMYLLPEFMLYGAAVSLLVISVIAYCARRALPRYEWLATAAAAFILLASLTARSPLLRHVELSLRRRVHEAEVARAASRFMVGPNAMVGSRSSVMFYAGGGSYYVDVGSSLANKENPNDVEAYFKPFDAIIEHPAFSSTVLNPRGKSLISWYVDGLLKLHGFYMSNISDTLPHLILSTKSVTQVQGFGVLPSRQIAHFQQDSSGDYVFSSAVCPIQANLGSRFPIFRNVYLLPLPTSQTPNRQVVTLVESAADYLVSRAQMASQCAVRDEVRLRMDGVDSYRLLATLKDDHPIRFYENRDDALEARLGPQHELRLTADAWPEGVHFRWGSAKGQDFSLSGDVAHQLFRSDMNTTADWEIYRYGRSGGLSIQPNCLAPGDSCGMYSSGEQRDHLASPFVALPHSGQASVFFSIWVKPLKDKAVPRISLQDERFSFLAETRELLTRKDGWVMLGNWLEVRDSQKLRLVLIQPRGTASLLDKALLVEFGNQPPTQPAAAKSARKR